MPTDERPLSIRRTLTGAALVLGCLATVATGCGRGRSAADGPTAPDATVTTTAPATGPAPSGAPPAPSTAASTTTTTAPASTSSTPGGNASTAGLDEDLRQLDRHLGDVDRDASAAGTALDNPQEDQ